jgi:hypothetical protein
MLTLFRMQSILMMVQNTPRKRFPLIRVIVTLAVMLSVPMPQGIAQPSPQPTAKPIQSPSTLEAILSLFKRKQARLVSRSSICAIAPGLLGEQNIIWSDSPRFLWQGPIQRVEVRPYSLEAPYQRQEILFQQSVAATDQQVMYSGKVLQPGQKYDWQIYLTANSAPNPRMRIMFQVMNQEGRDRITAELSALELRLKPAKATAEQIVLERAYYFADHELWSDALQEIYSASSLSPKLAQAAQDITAYLCTSEGTPSATQFWLRPASTPR